MKIVGLTGGIGSGKSTVASFFKKWGIPVYIADEEAKKLMLSPEIQAKVIALFGTKAYTDRQLNREFIADIVFRDSKMLDRLNAIVHPAVATHFESWVKDQDAPYVLKEAAILFENGAYLKCDFTIIINAPVETRIARVINRDNSTREHVIDRMEKQWPDEKKIPLADYIIHNTDLKNTEKEARKIHVKILGSPVNR